MLAYLSDSTKYDSPQEVMKLIFWECILSRAKKSLEHLKRFVEIYQKVFIKFFRINIDSQVDCINTVINVWGENNLFRAYAITEKLY